MNKLLLDEFVSFLINNDLDPRKLAMYNFSEEDVEAYLDRLRLPAFEPSFRDEAFRAQFKGENIFVRRLISQAKPVLLRLGKGHLLENLLVTEFPTSDFNAVVIGFRSGNAILLNYGTIRILGQASKLFVAILSCFGTHDDEPYVVEGKAEFLSVCVTTLGLLITSFARGTFTELVDADFINTVTNFHQWDEAMTMFRSSFLDGIELFILFHELSHIDLGHVAHASSHTVLSTPLSKAFSQSQKNEYDADAGALELLLELIGKDRARRFFEFSGDTRGAELHVMAQEYRSLLGDGPVGAFWNPELSIASVSLFFFIAEAIEYAAARKGAELAKTHPQARQREAKIRAGFVKAFGLTPQTAPQSIREVWGCLGTIRRPLLRTMKILAGLRQETRG